MPNEEYLSIVIGWISEVPAAGFSNPQSHWSVLDVDEVEDIEFEDVAETVPVAVVEFVDVAVGVRLPVEVGVLQGQLSQPAVIPEISGRVIEPDPAVAFSAYSTSPFIEYSSILISPNLPSSVVSMNFSSAVLQSLSQYITVLPRISLDSFHL